MNSLQHVTVPHRVHAYHLLTSLHPLATRALLVETEVDATRLPAVSMRAGGGVRLYTLKLKNIRNAPIFYFQRSWRASGENTPDPPQIDFLTSELILVEVCDTSLGKSNG